MKATIDALETQAEAEGSIGFLVEGIASAVEKVKGQSGDLLDNAVRANVENVVSQLKESPILAEALAAGKIKIVGGRYDLDSGIVEFTL